MEQVELTPADAPDLTELYGEYGWWDDRTTDEVREALANTPVAVGIRDDGDLVAAARAITDGVSTPRCTT